MAFPDSHQISSRGAAGVAALILAVFALVVLAAGMQLRGQWRSQVLMREGGVIHSVAAMERARISEVAAELGVSSTDEPFEVALQTSKNWHGVLAVRLFDVAGAFLDVVPLEVFEGSLAPADLRALSAGNPVTRFHRGFSLADLFLTGVASDRVPLLEVNIALSPGLASGGETTMVQYWIEGSAVGAELEAVDTRVLRQSLIAFVAGAFLIAGSLLWGFRRVGRVNSLLRARAHDLSRANRELAQSARTSAVGAITAHLVHGLRNPLSGLESFVAAQGSEPGEVIEWESARESARRMRALIDETHAVLGDVQSSADFEVTTSELCAGLRERLGAAAEERGIRIETTDSEVATLDSKTAGLGGLVLANLVQNAIEASPRGACVGVSVAAVDEFADFTVSDHGPGLAEDVASDPFRARRSTKPDGAGIGLAISWELARSAGGELALVDTTPNGAVFRLRLPATTGQTTGLMK